MEELPGRLGEPAGLLSEGAAETPEQLTGGRARFYADADGNTLDALGRGRPNPIERQGFVGDSDGGLRSASQPRGNLNTVEPQGPFEVPGNVQGVSPRITPDELTDMTRTQIRDLAEAKELVPSGQPEAGTNLPRKWKDPVTGKQRLRLDRGHIDPTTGLPYFDPKAAVDHVHGYEPNGTTKIRNPADNNPHFPTRGN